MLRQRWRLFPSRTLTIIVCERQEGTRTSTATHSTRECILMAPIQKISTAALHSFTHQILSQRLTGTRQVHWNFHMDRSVKYYYRLSAVNKSCVCFCRNARPVIPNRSLFSGAVQVGSHAHHWFKMLCCPCSRSPVYAARGSATWISIKIYLVLYSYQSFCDAR